MPILPFLDGSERSKRILKILISSAVGGLLGDVFLHILPHAIADLPPSAHDHSHAHGEEGGHDHGGALNLGLPILTGILLFFLAEKFVTRLTGGGHGHSHSAPTPIEADFLSDEDAASPKAGVRRRRASPTRKTRKSKVAAKPSEESKIKPSGWLNLVADMMHNFMDGVAIGVSFRQGFGLSTTVAVFFHEVPHNVADFAILIQSGFSKRKALLAQFVSATGALLGCIVGLVVQKAVGLDLFVAGGFIYIATVDVIPDLLQDTSVWQTLQEAMAMAAGVGMMALMLQFE